MPTCPSCAGRFDDATFCPRDGTRLVPDIGRLLDDRYRLLSKVGEGAMGEVFEALHVHINRRVAVKLLHRKLAADHEARKRLQREAQSTSAIEHVNIVESLDFGFTEEGQPYMVMEWLDGETLDHRLETTGVDIATALDIAGQVAAGLAEAHDRGVIHRDLKPANIFLIRDRKDRLVVKILDFGIAKLGVQETKLTGTGVLIGTPIYMAPEQAFGETVDARTDVYALGVILYEMLTGEVPFTADTPLAVLHQHTSKPPTLPSQRAPARGISPELDALVMRCMAKQPDARFATMRELATALDRARGQTPSPPAPRPPAPRQRTTPVPVTRIPPALDTDPSLPRMPANRRGIVIGIGVAGTIATGAIVFALLGGHDNTTTTDASTVATASDAGAVHDPRAQLADANVTTPVATGDEPATTIEGRAKQFAFTVTIAPAVPQPYRPIELAFQIRDPSPRLRDALAKDHVEAELSIAFFRDHSVVHESKHHVDRDGKFTATLGLAQIMKHHAHVHIVVDGREYDTARFDLFAPVTGTR